MSSGWQGIKALPEASTTLEQPATAEDLGRLPISASRAGRADLKELDEQRRERIRRRDAVHRRALAVADALAVALTLVVATAVMGEDTLTPSIAGALIGVILLMKIAGLYDRDEHMLHKTTLDEIPALFQVATLSALLLWLAGDLIAHGQLGRRQIFGIWMLLFVLLVIGRALARYIARRLTPTERCLVLGDDEAAELFRGKLRINPSVGATCVGSVPLELAANGGGNLSPLVPPDLGRILARQQVDRIIVAPGQIDSDALMHFVHEVRRASVAVSVLPATPPVPGSSSEVDQLHGLTLLGIHHFQMGRSSLFLKRGFDLVASSVLLLLLSPLLLAIALAIRLDTRGPILYRQRRVGRDGIPFEILKFRSMVTGAHARREELRELNDADGLFKIDTDPRVTRVGRVLRRWSLDELPQLLNVARGEMSLVGPRPLIPEEDSLIEGLYRRRLELAPGITGHWQALGASRIPLDEMVRLDYLYVANWSLWGDIRILFRTVPFVFGGQGR
jgi:exopolysaccharide biosynthesis polyprenyl glycosylphosphotransferase